MRLKDSLPCAAPTSSVPTPASTPARAASRSLISRSKAPHKEGSARRRPKSETAAQMLERLTNPLISLHEASVLLEVCSATVRHYSDNGTLHHERTAGGQRRFYLRDVLNLRRERESRQRQTRSVRRRPTPAPLATEHERAARPTASRPMTLPSSPANRSGVRPAPAARPAREGERPSSLVLRAGLRAARRS